MKILAFDQSTQVTGWAKYVDGQLIDYGSFDLSKNKDAEDRFHQMSICIETIVQDFAPDSIVAEDVSLQNPNVKTVVTLARLQGIIISAGLRLCPPVQVAFVTPSHWRKTVGIKTGAKIKRTELKHAAMDLVKQLHGVDVKDDIADAILIGQCAVALANE